MWKLGELLMRKYDIDPNIKVRKLEELIDVPSFVYVNKFDEESVKAFTTLMMETEQRNQAVVPIIIDSYGGEAYALLAMIDVVKHCKKPVATIVVGKAMSCGAMLFAMGSDGLRFMGPAATLMFHDVSSFNHGKIEEIKASAEESERLNQLVFKMIARNCGHSDTYFLDAIHARGHADWFLAPDEALKHKVATSVRIPEFNVKVNVDVKFG